MWASSCLLCLGGLCLGGGAVPGITAWGAVMEGRGGCQAVCLEEGSSIALQAAAPSECGVYKADASSQGVRGSPSFS